MFILLTISKKGGEYAGLYAFAEAGRDTATGAGIRLEGDSPRGGLLRRIEYPAAGYHDKGLRGRPVEPRHTQAIRRQWIRSHRRGAHYRGARSRLLGLRHVGFRQRSRRGAHHIVEQGES